MKLNEVDNKERRRVLSVSGQYGFASAVSFACIILHVLSTAFRGGHFLCLAFGSFIYPAPPPRLIIFFTDKLVRDMGLVPLAWGLTARRRGFTSQTGVTLSRGWLCQKWKPLDMPGTHLH